MRTPLIVLNLFAALGCAPSAAILRKEFTHEAVIRARPEQVFPLLCPIRENEWIDGWRAEVLYSKSGLAEDNAVFRTHLRLGETWVTSRHEPANHRVEYTIFAGDHAVMRMDLALDDQGDGTSRLRTRRTYTSLDWLGRRAVADTSQEEIDRAQDLIARQLNQFLETRKASTSK